MDVEILYIIVSVGLVVFLAIAFSYEYYEYKSGVATFPSMRGVRKKISEILQADAAQRVAERPYIVIDIGSGSGQLTRAVALALPEAKVIGVELAYIPWLRSVLRQKVLGPANLSYQRGDFWPYDCSAASAVLTYLPGKIMERVGQKLRRELRSETLVVANSFPLRADWVPAETMVLHAPWKTELFLYRQKV